jgi:hypothetical protein
MEKKRNTSLNFKLDGRDLRLLAFVCPSSKGFRTTGIWNVLDAGYGPDYKPTLPPGEENSYNTPVYRLVALC